MLKVSKDLERNELKNMPYLISALKNLLVGYSWPVNARSDVVFDIESQETVDREYKGNWFYRYK
jgi:hypothetical protein